MTEDEATEEVKRARAQALADRSALTRVKDDLRKAHSEIAVLKENIDVINSNPSVHVINALMDSELSGYELSVKTKIATHELYPLLVKLEAAGSIIGRWEDEEHAPRLRLYTLSINMSNIFSVHAQVENRLFFLGTAAVSTRIDTISLLPTVQFTFKTETTEAREVLKLADTFQFKRQNKVYEVEAKNSQQ